MCFVFSCILSRLGTQKRTTDTTVAYSFVFACFRQQYYFWWEVSWGLLSVTSMTLVAFPLFSLSHLCHRISSQSGRKWPAQHQTLLGAVWTHIFFHSTRGTGQGIEARKNKLGIGQWMWTDKHYLKQMPVQPGPDLTQSEWGVEIVSF